MGPIGCTETSARILDSWGGRIGCTETLARNYHYALSNNPEQRSSKANRIIRACAADRNLHIKWPLGLVLWFQLKSLDVVWVSWFISTQLSFFRRKMFQMHTSSNSYFFINFHVYVLIFLVFVRKDWRKRIFVRCCRRTVVLYWVRKQVLCVTDRNCLLP